MEDSQYLQMLKKIFPKKNLSVPGFFETRLWQRIREKETNILVSPVFIALARKTLLVLFGLFLIAVTLSLTRLDIPGNIYPDNYLLSEINNNHTDENNFWPEKNITEEDVIILAYYR